METRRQADEKAIQQKQNDEAFSQHAKESNARIKYAEIEARENAAIAQIRINNGCNFVDPPIVINAPVTNPVVIKGKTYARPMSDGSVICDRFNNTAVVRNGVATDLKSLGTNKQ